MGMSLGGFGIVVLVGALLTTYIIRCTSGRGAKKGDEEKVLYLAKIIIILKYYGSLTAMQHYKLNKE